MQHHLSGFNLGDSSAEWFQSPLCFHSLRRQHSVHPLHARTLNCETDNGAILKCQWEDTV